MTNARKEDRRIRRTRRLLQDGLITLLRRKPLAKIQIKEIVEEADVSRPTFYHHFATKEKLLFSLMDDLFDEIHTVVFEGREGDEPLDILEVLTSSFEQWLLHSEELRWVFQVEDRDLLIAALTPHVEALKQEVDKHFPPSATENTRACEGYVTSFIAGGLYNLLRTWIDTGMRESAETMGKIAYLLVDGGFAPMRAQASADRKYMSTWLSDWKTIAASVRADMK